MLAESYANDADDEEYAALTSFRSFSQADLSQSELSVQRNGDPTAPERLPCSVELCAVVAADQVAPPRRNRACSLASSIGGAGDVSATRSATLCSLENALNGYDTNNNNNNNNNDDDDDDDVVLCLRRGKRRHALFVSAPATTAAGVSSSPALFATAATAQLDSASAQEPLSSPTKLPVSSATQRLARRLLGAQNSQSLPLQQQLPLPLDAQQCAPSSTSSTSSRRTPIQQRHSTDSAAWSASSPLINVAATTTTTTTQYMSGASPPSLDTLAVNRSRASSDLASSPGSSALVYESTPSLLCGSPYLCAAPVSTIAASPAAGVLSTATVAVTARATSPSSKTTSARATMSCSSGRAAPNNCSDSFSAAAGNTHTSSSSSSSSSSPSFSSLSLAVVNSCCAADLSDSTMAERNNIAEAHRMNEPVHISHLPSELLLEVFSCLCSRDLAVVRRVCHGWNALLQGNDYVWHRVCTRAKLNEELRPPERTWKWFYSAAFQALVPPASGVGYCEPNGAVVQYHGDWKDGKRDGYGWIETQDGSVYFGFWKDDKRHGAGVYRRRGGGGKGQEYRGNWVDDRKDGFGVLRCPEGDVFEGTWTRDHRCGHGTYRWPSGNVYTGEWQRDAMNGYGTKMWFTGDRYDGWWCDGVRTGPGVYSWFVGDRYIGELLDGKEHGYGVYLWADGRMYCGTWARSNQEGAGVFVWPDGSCYFGMWRQGMRAGYGELREPLAADTLSQPSPSAPTLFNAATVAAAAAVSRISSAATRALHHSNDNNNNNNNNNGGAPSRFASRPTGAPLPNPGSPVQSMSAPSSPTLTHRSVCHQCAATSASSVRPTESTSASPPPSSVVVVGRPPRPASANNKGEIAVATSSTRGGTNHASSTINHHNNSHSFLLSLNNGHGDALKQAVAAARTAASHSLSIAAEAIAAMHRSGDAAHAPSLPTLDSLLFVHSHANNDNGTGGGGSSSSSGGGGGKGSAIMSTYDPTVGIADTCAVWAGEWRADQRVIASPTAASVPPPSSRWDGFFANSFIEQRLITRRFLAARDNL